MCSKEPKSNPPAPDPVTLDEAMAAHYPPASPDGFDPTTSDVNEDTPTPEEAERRITDAMMRDRVAAVDEDNQPAPTTDPASSRIDRCKPNDPTTSSAKEVQS